MGVWKDLARGAVVEILRWFVHYWGDSGKGSCDRGVDKAWEVNDGPWIHSALSCIARLPDLERNASEAEALRGLLESCQRQSCLPILALGLSSGLLVGILVGWLVARARGQREGRSLEAELRPSRVNLGLLSKGSKRAIRKLKKS